VIAEAEERRKMYRQRTILFIDEVHRWNKAQQDALLPHVETGMVTLIGATTENPYFEVIRALVSRSRIFQLQPLTEEHLGALIDRALSDSERGYGKRKVVIDPAARQHLIDVSGGDARNVLNALELAVESTPPDENGQIFITTDIAQESIQRRVLLYDKDGDNHYDTISAFIKSVRGSDPDAALYWLAKMLNAGEDPRFILRRLIILAGEDIGLADPQGLVVATAAATAFDYIGLPEGIYPITEATLYLATAPKSNSTGAYYKAAEEIEKHGAGPVPIHLMDASRDAKGLGHGQRYQYPHSFPGHYTPQQYLPSNLLGTVFYEPSEEGFEARIAERMAKIRAAAREYFASKEQEKHDDPSTDPSRGK
jgi:putative ATPase